MSDDLEQATAAAALIERVDVLASEVAALRESIVTAAEWDAESRRVRQVALDTTLTEVRQWLRILIGVIAVLAVLVIWLVFQINA